MAEQLKFLAWSRSGENEKQLMDALAAFNTANPGIKPTIHIPVPGQMWPEILQTALYGLDTDIGEVGSTYIESLKGMNALRPFSNAEVLSFGGESAFVRAVFQAGCDLEKQVWAIPWSTDSRVIFYRRDLLAKAGIPEENAFRTPANMEQTLHALQASGVEVPLALCTESAQAQTSFTACWVWGAGGNFINETGTEVVFNTAEAQKGFCDYFNLHRYLAPAAQNLDLAKSDMLFRDGIAAVTYAGTWLPDYIERKNFPNIEENLGVALPPGVPLVGGTHLVLWKHSIKDRSALKLIHSLTSQEVLIRYPKMVTIPARLDALSDPVYSGNLLAQTFNEAIRTGRSVPSLPLWALVEDRLGKVLQQMWRRIESEPDINIENLVADSMNTLTRRLQSTLQSTIR